eukprot:TRINITY_DN7935_c0_g1_i4.p1 TRINITY_DN7935_c0_g1~~TRINITY_DN7935_c0_g1_i4.p1  ORF type:complete len:614 (+),score=62.36 TRINITY_DN7935_c0_g1_i4:44-1885(+)
MSETYVLWIAIIAVQGSQILSSLHAVYSSASKLSGAVNKSKDIYSIVSTELRAAVFWPDHKRTEDAHIIFGWTIVYSYYGLNMANLLHFQLDALRKGNSYNVLETWCSFLFCAAAFIIKTYPRAVNLKYMDVILAPFWLVTIFRLGVRHFIDFESDNRLPYLGRYFLALCSRDLRIGCMWNVLYTAANLIYNITIEGRPHMLESQTVALAGEAITIIVLVFLNRALMFYWLKKFANMVGEAGAATQLLRGLCDAVVEVEKRDSEYVLATHSEQLATMLGQTSGQNQAPSLKGQNILRFLSSELDADRLSSAFERHEASAAEAATSQAAGTANSVCQTTGANNAILMPAQLKDALGTVLNVEFLSVSIVGSRHQRRYLVGIREFEERDPIALLPAAETHWDHYSVSESLDGVLQAGRDAVCATDVNKTRTDANNIRTNANKMRITFDARSKQVVHANDPWVLKYGPASNGASVKGIFAQTFISRIEQSANDLYHSNKDYLELFQQQILFHAPGAPTGLACQQGDITIELLAVEDDETVDEKSSDDDNFFVLVNVSIDAFTAAPDTEVVSNSGSSNSERRARSQHSAQDLSRGTRSQACPSGSVAKLRVKEVLSL